MCKLTLRVHATLGVSLFFVKRGNSRRVTLCRDARLVSSERASVPVKARRVTSCREGSKITESILGFDLFDNGRTDRASLQRATRLSNL